MIRQGSEKGLDGRRRFYSPLEKTADLAELIGIILGDGHLTRYVRTERLVITCGFKKTRYIKQVAQIVKNVFSKPPSIIKRKTKEAFDISLYQCDLSKRLGVPTGNKIKNDVGVPAWIKKNKEYIIRCLKGLFETDGCFQRDPSNYAQYIELKNLCSRIKLDTYYMLIGLGYNPQISTRYVRLARKNEVSSFIGEALGLSENDTDSLTKANKVALKAIADFIHNEKMEVMETE